ncbi:MAG TPA: hypothetical protein VFR37_15705, partial [Longimicrobium sp.]|nr:hypothetical protein [Longimicrobium sp.]
AMLTSSERRDFILRMIAQVRQMVAAVMGKVQANESAAEALALARESIATLLGPMADVALRLDSATAAQMVSDPAVLHAWAEFTAAEAEVHRAEGDAATAVVLARRALELAREAHQRAPADVPELLALIARLQAQVDAPAPPSPGV